MPTNALNWFEIPVRDLGRAAAFYEKLLQTSLRRESMGPNTLAVFPYTEPGVGGCLIAGDGYAPGPGGAVVYLAAGDSIEATLARLEAAGGSIATSRTQLPGDMGAFAHILDSEGNRVGLHAAR